VGQLDHLLDLFRVLRPANECWRVWNVACSESERVARPEISSKRVQLQRFLAVVDASIFQFH
jgi:hypothetical protein